MQTGKVVISKHGQPSYVTVKLIHTLGQTAFMPLVLLNLKTLDPFAAFKYLKQEYETYGRWAPYL